ncbi:MAG TPA: alpha/beta hydrolase [Candidatus Limnocylindria bacterium]
MGAYAELTQGSVWYDERGVGEPLVLLHGGAVDSRFFEHNIGPLAEQFRVIAIDLWGHGRTPDRDGAFSLESFAIDVAELIDRVVGGPAHVLGHSIGAEVALAVALRRPDLVRRLVNISGGLNQDVDITPVVDEQIEQTVAFLGPTYGAVSPDGEDHFAVVVRKDFELSASGVAFTADDVAAITARSLVMAADDDLLPIERFADLYRAIPDAELSVVPGTSHFLLQEKPEACNAVILDFLTNDRVPNVAPIRRGSAVPPG